MIIIDDEPLVLEYLTDFINSEISDINVEAAFDISANALNYIKRNPVDIILTDISMPAPTGIDIAEICHKTMPGTLVIFITAYRDFDYARSAITNDVFDYILKPLSKQDLRRCLTAAINKLNCRNSLKGFASNEFVASCQEVFSDLIFNCISNVDGLKERLKAIGLDESLADNKCVILDLFMNDISNYLYNIWKHGDESFFDSLLRFLCTETERSFFAPIWYTNNKLEIIGIGTEPDISHEEILSDFKANIQDELKTLFSLDMNVSSSKSFSSVRSIISDTHTTDPDNDIIKKALSYIEQNFAKHITLEDVAKHVSLNRIYFSNYYKKHTGENFITTLNYIRIKKAKELLKEHGAKISYVMHATGFNHSTYFYKTFKEIAGCSPTEYQERIQKENGTKK